jgi:chorismate mutase/prephenate dehydratase
MTTSSGGGPQDPKPEKRALEGLDDLRAQLDQVDHQLVAQLRERDRLVMEVARRKSQKGDGRVRDPVREEAMLARLSSEGQASGLDGFYVTRVFREVLDHSVRLQQEYLAQTQDPERAGSSELVVSYQGVDGAYSHLAAMRHFGPRGGHTTFRGYPTFRAMMEAVRDGQAQYGVLPIENTTAGSINDAYDLLAQMDLSVVGEEVQKVDHCLVALEMVPLSRIRRVFSHPQALAQCSNFLSGLSDCHVEAFADTAMSVKRVGEEQDLSQAAIASEEAARRYGLMVIKRDIANQKENFTRMVVVAARPEKVDPRVSAKTSLIFATKHEEGALLGCLNALAKRHLSLTKLESRPRPHTPWEYLFYVDFEGNVDDTDVLEALTELRTQTSFLRVLGSYPARTTRESRAAEPKAPKPEGQKRERPAPLNMRESNLAIDARELSLLPHHLTSRKHRAEDTTFEVGNALIGGPDLVISARIERYDTRDSLLRAARAVRAAGANLLWAPCFDARAKEQGAAHGVEPLIVLEEAGKLAGIPVATEVLHPADVDRAVARVDVLVVGASQMQNDALLREVGRVDRPVILERAMMASLEEWLLAAERVLSRGNHRLILCERGIRTFERATTSTLDLSALVVLRERSHLPVFVDPFRATGNARWAMPLAEGARGAGAQGLVLSVAAEEQADAAELRAEQLAPCIERLRQLG